MFNEKVCLEKFAPAISSFIYAEPKIFTTAKVAKEDVKRKNINPNQLGSFTRTIMGGEEHAKGCPRVARVQRRTNTWTAPAAEAAKIIDNLPFHLPYDDWLRHVGNTPLVQVGDGIHAKLEGFNPGGSIKDRALTSIFLNKFITGELKPNGSTLCLVTSGWAGLSLARLHQAIAASNTFDCNLCVVIPLAYAEKAIPAKLVEMEGVTSFYGGFEEYLGAKEKGELGEADIR